MNPKTIAPSVPDHVTADNNATTTNFPVSATECPASETGREQIATLLAKFKKPDGTPKYEMIGDKPVIWIDVKTVLTVKSDPFQDKLLCDGLTMNAGDACAFSCTFCYVPAAMLKLRAPLLAEFNLETGLNLNLSQVVIRRRAVLDVLNGQLLHEDGSRIYDDPNDNRVLYSSTLVDVAATMDILQETADACTFVLENTEWQIRLLSKSPLLKQLVTKELIPEKYHRRLILGFSTGTLDDKLAATIERDTGLVSKRIAALHELQDRGIRTFAMICPSLPYGTQEEYDEFSRKMCEELRIDRCEHVWAEVINLRGSSFSSTVSALRKAGYETEAARLETMSGTGKKEALEEYARMTFEAHKKHVPNSKLRFLQYVNADTADFWSSERQNGAVLLGSYAEQNQLITIASSTPSEPLPALDDDDIRYREEREHIVTGCVKASIAAAAALYQIHTYKNGLLWRKNHRTFEDYCKTQWGYQKSQAYRFVQTGAFVAKLAENHSPLGENNWVTESHLRPVLTKVEEEHQVECWQAVTDKVPEAGKLTASEVASKVTSFLKKKKIATKTKRAKAPKPSKPDARAAAKLAVANLKANLEAFERPEHAQSLLDQLLKMIGQEPAVEKAEAHESEQAA